MATVTAMVMFAAVLVSLSGVTARPAQAQGAKCTWAQVSELGAGTKDGLANGEVVAFQGRLYLSGSTNLGTEPVSYDGSKYRVLRNIGSGRISSFPEFKIATRSKVYFTANVPGLGRELWASDGTTSGTRLVRELSSGRSSTFFREFAVVGNQVFFTVQAGGGYQLWRTNGVGSGTRLVRKFPIGAQPRNLIGLNGKVLFRGNDAGGGNELWVSNGTGRGTRRVIDLNPGTTSSNATPIRAYRGRVYLTAYAGSGRPSLWSTDGTRAGTRAVAELDLNERVDPRVVDSTIMGGRLYLWVEDRASEGTSPRRTDLWTTNGTQAGTRLVVNTNAIGFGAGTARPQTIASNGWIFYQSDEAASGREWHAIKPGQSGGRTNINPGSADASASGAIPVAYKGSVYVAAENPAIGRELWRLNCPS